MDTTVDLEEIEEVFLYSHALIQAENPLKASLLPAPAFCIGQLRQFSYYYYLSRAKPKILECKQKTLKLVTLSRRFF